MKQRFGIFLASAAMALGASAFEANYDEAKVPDYELPDPLASESGGRVESAEQWKSSRRGELLEEFSREMFGVMPAEPDGIAWEVFEESDEALGGGGQTAAGADVVFGRPAWAGCRSVDLHAG